MSGIMVTEKILSYVEEHLESELSLEKIADALNYSKFYIARAFKENTGVTLYQYIRGRRLNEAARKLTESKRPVVEIAFEAGYSSQQAFIQAFHREYQCTPQEYRRIGRFLPKQNRIESNADGRFMMHAFCFAGGEMAA